MAVRLVFMDLDDTFVSPDKTITADNPRALDLAHERGVGVVPCTGRSAAGIPDELASHPSVRYAVCAGGAVIYDLRANEVLRELAIEKDLMLDLYGAVRDLPVTFDVLADGVVRTPRDRWPLLDRIAVSEPTRQQVKSVRVPYDGTVEELVSGAGSVGRVNIFYLTEKDRKAVWDAVDARPALCRSSSLPCNVEVTRADATKGTALLWLCERLGVSPEDTVAFGDSTNDVPMLLVAGDGVAMANACPECLAAADHVTASCSESGVARYLENLFLA